MTEVLGSLGTVSVFAECAFSEELDRWFDLLLVDASGLQMELAERVGWLHGRFPTVPIVVLTSSPTWRRARAVLQAGASDYMRRSMEDDILLERCRSLFAWSP
ncbi:MAG: response regulator transcription factor [Anaerolineae bacterium]|nr:response regulator transcription factor [Anaerolineae bacterium]